MKINLHEALITPNFFKRICVTLDLSDSELLLQQGITAEKADAAIEIKNTADVVSVRFFGDIPYRTVCDRCLAEIKTSLHFDYVRDVQKTDVTEDFEGIVLSADEQLDIEQELKNEVLISFPAKHLCKEDCRGLCPVCGCNLNEQKCSCVQKELDPRLEVLRNLSL